MFWEKFSALCVESGKSPNGVAKELGIPSGSVTAWKNGSIPRSLTLVKIASYFDVAVSMLTEEPDQKEKSPTPNGAELIPGYEDLSEENKIKAKDFVAFLLSQQ